MLKNKKVLIGILAAVLAIVLAVSAIFIFKKDPAKSMFDGNTTTYTLSSDYKLGSTDVKATGGKDKAVTLNKAATFDLNQKTLDLNGYTLKIADQTDGATVTFKNGTIKNGTLDVSVPNGDVEFDGANVDSSVSYDLEAASNTIRFSNAKVSGKGRIKSDTHVQVDFSTLDDVSLEGNGSLTAGENATLGNLKVSDKAAGAKITISKLASVKSMAIAAKAEVKVAGQVETVAVSETATNAKEISISVEKTATVASVELNAAAKVEVAGTVAKVVVAETAVAEDAKAEVKIAASASVENIDLQAKTDVEVKGAVSNVTVGDKASGTNVKVEGEYATTGRVIVNATGTTLEGDSIQKVIVSKDLENDETIVIPETVETEYTENIQDIIKPHTYEITEEVKATCEKEGYTTYTCTDCDDSYTVNFPKKPHNHEKEIVRLPSKYATGLNRFTCVICGHSYEERIEAIGLESESIYELISLLLPEGSFSFKVNEGSKINLYNKNNNVNKYYPTELQVVELNAYEAAITSKDGKLTGYMLMEVVVYSSEFENNDNLTIDKNNSKIQKMLVSFYLNDGVAYVENTIDYTGYEQDYGHKDENYFNTADLEFLDLLLSQIPLFGKTDVITAENISKAINLINYISVSLGKYQPFVDAIINANQNNAPVEGINAEQILEFLNEYVLSTEEVEGNTVYTVSFSGLTQLTTVLSEKTIAQLIAENFGEDALENLATTVKGIPDMTVGEIADLAIELAENYDFDVDFTFSFVEKVIKDAAEIAGMEIPDVDLKAMLESVSDVKVIDVVYELANNDNPEFPTKDTFKENLIAMVDDAVAFAEDSTIDNLITMIVDMLPTPAPEEGEEIPEEDEQEPFVLSEVIRGLLIMADEYSDFSFVIDAEGNLVAIDVNVMEMVIASYSFSEQVYTITAEYAQYKVEITYTPETELAEVKVSIYDEGTEQTTVYTGSVDLGSEVEDEEVDFNALVKLGDRILAQIIADIDKDDVNTVIKGVVSAMDYTLTVDANKNEGSASVIVSAVDYETGEPAEFASLVVSTEDDGTVIYSVKYMGAEVATFSVNGTDITDFTSQTVICVGPYTLDLSASVAPLENDGEYRIYLSIDGTGVEMAEDEEPEPFAFKAEIILDVALVDGENEKTAEFDLTIKVGETELETVFDGAINFTVNFDGEGSLDTIDIVTDVDKMNVGKYATSISPEMPEEYLPDYENYADMHIDFTIDFSAESADMSGLEDVKENLKKYEGITFEYTEFDYDNYKTYTKSLTYDEDENGAGYYKVQYTHVDKDLGVTETTTATVPAKDGLPAYAAVNISTECKDWISFSYRPRLAAEVKVFETETGELADEPYNAFFGFDFYGYYNLVTHEFISDREFANSKIHTLKYTCTELNGENCHGGLDIVITCEYCDYHDHEESGDCYYKYEEVKAGTTFNSDLMVVLRECVNCGNQYYSDYGYDFYHQGEYQIPITKADLPQDAISDGFTKGHKDVYVCSITGVKKTVYKYGTHKNGVCVTHTHVVYNYAGQQNQDTEEFAYAPFNYTLHCIEYDCFKSDVSKVYVYNECDLADVIINKSIINNFITKTLGNQAQNVINRLGANDKNQAFFGVYACELCGNVTNKDLNIDLIANESDNLTSIGAVERYDALGVYHDTEIYSNDVQFVLNYLAKDLENCEVEIDADDVHYIWLDDYSFDHNGFERFNLEIKVYAGEYLDEYEIYAHDGDEKFNDSFVRYMVEFYDYSACKEYRKEYVGDELWGEEEYEKHDTSKDNCQIGNSNCCSEDGYDVKLICDVCHKIVDEYKNYSHCNDFHWFKDEPIANVKKYVTEDALNFDGIASGEYCCRCEKGYGIVITLNSNWTLTENVYLYAEDITLDLNGYDIDLNGYNLIIYGIDGSYVTITNSQADGTTPTEEYANITNGTLIIFNNFANKYPYSYEESIIVSFVAVDVFDYFFSENDTRETIQDSFGEPISGFSPSFN